MNVPATDRRIVGSRVWRRRIAAAVAVAAPILIALVGYLLHQQVTANDALRHAELDGERHRIEIMRVLSAHQDMETGARGYVITGDTAFLAPYRAGREDLKRIFDRARRRAGNDPIEAELLQKVGRLSAMKLAFTQSNIELRKSGDFDGAVAQVKSGKGRHIMDAIRREVAALVAHNDRDLDRITSQSNAAVVRLRNQMFALLASLTVLLIIAALAIQNFLRARDDALIVAEDLSLRQKAILDHAMDGIVTLNPSGTLEDVNEAILRMFGYERADLDRRDFGILMASRPPIGMVAQTLRAMNLFEAGEGITREVSARRADGSEFPAEIGVSVMLLNEGLRYVVLIRDVTERKRVEQLKSDFVSTVSHELRTPLTSIAGSLGLLAGGAAGPLAERAARLITIAHNNAERLVRLINDILDIDKIESGKMPFNNRDLDLRALVGDAIETNRGFGAKFDVTLELSAPDTAMIVNADSDRLMQVLTNLISNACKFSPRGGLVEVSIHPRDTSYRITVADHGAGIPEEFRSRIFGRFAQADSSDSREKGGTGLGLNIVAEIVKRLNGSVSFDSEPGQGTQFHVDLPAVVPAAASNSGGGTTSLDRSGETPDRRSMLVCGNGAGSTFTQALRGSGYDVTFVRDAAGTRDALAKGRFDGIVVDMGLTEGMGIELIRLIREDERQAGVPILALGGKPGRTEFEGDAALVLDWLRHPQEVSRLVDNIDTAASGCESDRPRVLHVEDDRDVVELVAAALEGRARVTPINSVAAAQVALNRQRFDLVILDLSLADGSGIELLSALRQVGGAKPIPVVIFSAQDADPHIAGLVDAYLTKARAPIGDLVEMVETLTQDRNGAKPAS